MLFNLAHKHTSEDAFVNYEVVNVVEAAFEERLLWIADTEVQSILLYSIILLML